VPTWPVITFTGPVTNPSVTFSNNPVTIGYTGNLASGSTLVIDTRPWARTFLLNGASAAGLMSGSPLIAMQLQPGTVTATFGGTISGSVTPTCVVSWYNALQTIGGSY